MPSGNLSTAGEERGGSPDEDRTDIAFLSSVVQNDAQTVIRNDGHVAERKSHCLRRHWKKILILLFVICIGIYVAVDQILKPCDNFETTQETQLRLINADLPQNFNNHTNCAGCRTSSECEQRNFKLSSVDGLCHFRDGCVLTAFSAFIKWMQANLVLGGFLFMIIYAIGVVLFLPASFLTIGAGAAFAAVLGLGYGVLIGSVVVFVGATIGAICAFFLGRYALKRFVQRLIARYTLSTAIDAAIRDNGYVVIFLLRLSPLIPFSALNYVLAGTSIRPRQYIIGSLAMIPGTVGYVYIGASIHLAATQSRHGSDMTIRNILLIVGSIAAFLVVIVISFFAKRKLNRRIAIAHDREQGSDSNNRVDIVNEALGATDAADGPRHGKLPDEKEPVFSCDLAALADLE